MVARLLFLTTLQRRSRRAPTALGCLVLARRHLCPPLCTGRWRARQARHVEAVILRDGLHCSSTFKNFVLSSAGNLTDLDCFSFGM